MGLKEWIIPQDKAFFDILEKESENVAVGAQKLEEAIGEFDRMDERRRELKDIEHDEDEIGKRCREIDSLENEADVLLNDALAELFKGKDVIQIMKLKEIYEYLETATDKCEDVSLVLRDVVMTRS